MYPERLGKAIIVNAPWLFQGVWAVIKPLLNQVTDTQASPTCSRVSCATSCFAHAGHGGKGAAARWEPGEGTPTYTSIIYVDRWCVVLLFSLAPTSKKLNKSASVCAGRARAYIRAMITHISYTHIPCTYTVSQLQKWMLAGF
jgi:hypothetical protein